MWLYVPSACVPASEGSTSASELPNPERVASLTWRGKPARPQVLSRAWKRGGFIRLLSGLTCELSTLEHGAARWIASCLAIPAKETALPESALAKPTTVGCSTGRSRSSIKAGLLCSSARTCRGTSAGNLRSLSQHWSDWAAALRAEFSARVRSEPATGASGSSSWPTACVTDSNGARNATSGRSDPNSKHHAGVTLNDAIWMWATPQARDHFPAHTKEYVAAKKAQGHGMRNLNDEAAQWPTPMAGSAGTDTYNAAGNSDFSRKAEELAKGVRAFAMTDLSLPDRPTPSGEKSSEVRRRLNPLFVEWLMGWPEGLSGFDTAVMASCRSPQLSPGCGCMNCWLTTQRAMLSDLLTIEPPAQATLL